MATPTTLPASFTDATVLPASSLNDLRGAFRILQVVQGATSTTTSTTSGTNVDTTLSATITPQSSSSKILAMITQTAFCSTSATDSIFQLVRGSTAIATNKFVAYGSTSANVVSWALNYLDSPATTSATTYKTQMRRDAGGGTVITQVGDSLSTLTLFEVSA
jgi:hypothetical protein